MRRIVKKSALKGHPKLVSETQKVNTNLEKKTQHKINTMSAANDSLTMDFVLKNRKLLEHLKKCKVFLSKSMRKNLFTKYATMKSALKTQRKNQIVKIARPRGRPKKVIEPLPDQNGTPGSSNSAKKSSKKDSPPDAPSGGRIFIRLPTTPSKRSIQKRTIFDKIAGRTNLVNKFGSAIFKCHVRVRRMKNSDPLFFKKVKKHRKTVSFMETVEIFGESDVEYEKDSTPEPDDEEKSNEPNEPTTSTPATKNRIRKVDDSKQKLYPKSPRISLAKADKNKATPSPKKQGTPKMKQATPNAKGENNKSPRSAKKQETPKLRKTTPNAKQDKTSPPQSKRKQENTKKDTTQEGSPKKNQRQQRSPKKADSPNKADSPKKKSPKKNQEDAALQLSFVEGKQCFVRLNRNSTELANLSATSIAATETNEENNEINGTECTQAVDEDVIMENVDDKDTENDEDHIDNVDDTTSGDVQKETDDDNNANVELTLEDEDVLEQEESVHGEENIDATNDLIPSVENNGAASDLNDVSNANVCDSMYDPILSDEEDLTDETDLEQIWNDSEKKKLENLTASSGGESFHTTIDSKQLEENDDDMGKDQALNDTNNPESRASTPTQSFDPNLPELGEPELESIRLSPLFSNGSSLKNRKPSPLPNPEDLFDMLKSNKLPEPTSTSRRVPSPTRGLTDDEDDLIPNADTSVNYDLPVSDLIDESDSANDSRFSLNTFFKSVKDKFMAKRAENGSPSHSSPRHDDLNLNSQDRNLDSPATHEITTQ